MDSVLAKTVCFVACHTAPAEHFTAFQKSLEKRGYTVQIYGSGPGFDKFEQLHVRDVTKFSTEGDLAALLQKCRQAAVVITDVGHPFVIELQKGLKREGLFGLAYYDNPEAYVPGGYSDVAKKVMEAATGVLFANATLVDLKAPEREIGVGYYPLARAEEIAIRRKVEQKSIRREFFSSQGMEDLGQKILVYAGGNNETYFDEAFPAFLRFLEKAALEWDLSHCVVLLQQHPGAKKENRDGIQTLERFGNKIYLSTCNSDDAQVMADAIFYYQTSMGPQFVLAGIPTIQVGHEPYRDILVRNQLCKVVKDWNTFLEVIINLEDEKQGSREGVFQGLGIHVDWEDRLERALKR